MHVDPLTAAASWAGLVFAQSGGFNWWDDLRTWGPGGVLVVLVLIGIIVPKYVVDRMDRDLARVIKQRDDLIAQQAEVIPVLGTVIPTMSRLEQALVAQTREVEQVREELRRLQSTVNHPSRGAGG